MPKKLKEFLSELTNDEAKEILDYLNRSQYAEYYIAAAIVNSHYPGLES